MRVCLAHYATKLWPAFRGKICNSVARALQMDAFRLDHTRPLLTDERCMVSDQRKAPGLKQEWGMGGLTTAPQTPTAPATVCGERPSKLPLILNP